MPPKVENQQLVSPSRKCCSALLCVGQGFVWQKTMWQHWSIHCNLTWLQLFFMCSLDWNRQSRDRAFVMLLTSLRVQEKRWKGFYKMDSMNVSNILTVTGLAQVCSCTRRLFWWKCNISECTVVYFSDISDSGNIFKLSHIFKLQYYSNGLPVVITDDHRASWTWWIWTTVVLQLMPGEAPYSLEALFCV